jgi:predicted nucleic acid-binding protein
VIFVDSSVWIDFFNGHSTHATARLAQALAVEPVLVGDLVLCEVLRGARSEAQAVLLERELRKCRFVSMLDTDLAVTAAKNYRLLRAKGFTVRSTIDLIIGSYCIAHRHTLLHTDRDYDPMQHVLGLKVVPTTYMVNEPALAYG